MGSGSLARWSIPRRGWINGNKRKAYGARRRGGLSCVRRLASCAYRMTGGTMMLLEFSMSPLGKGEGEGKYLSWSLDDPDTCCNGLPDHPLSSITFNAKKVS